jgi:glycine betaine transporter
MKNASFVFYTSVAIMAILVLAGVTMPAALERVTGNLQAFITDAFGWYYLIVVTLFVGVCLYLLVSPVGRIKLGKQEDKPEFSRPTWLAMLFSAGVGIGLIFYGTAEPISHYAISSPTGETGTDQAIKDAMRFTFFHWGFHAWAIYGIVALALAYFTFRKDEKVLISKTLRPLIGKYADGMIGKIIDVIAVISTVIGVATTLGFGAMQINGGLSYLFGTPSNMTSQFVIVLVLTILFMISALTGLSKGIKILSNMNMGLSFVLFLFVFLFGSTLFTLNMFTHTVGTYIQNFINMSFRIAPMDEESRSWINGWTIFYWAWWIAWSPFVGIFIARVSKGRTIREFVVCVLLVPSLISFIWFSTFGSTAVLAERTGIAAISTLAAEESLFGLLESFPISMVVSILAIVIIITFFVTSADSGTFVLGMMTTDGSQNPSNSIKITWGILLATTALALLYSGGLQALQNTMIVAALPFSVIIALMTYSLIKSLNKEVEEIKVSTQRKKEIGQLQRQEEKRLG